MGNMEIDKAATVSNDINSLRKTNIYEISEYQLNSVEYPDRLRNILNPPEKIYVSGRLPESNLKTVAVVGARECSHYGKQVAYEYSRIFAQENVQIISGLARGVDAAAHRGALSAGKRTYAVMGCGADVCYPAQNRQLYEEIRQSGGIISEYENGSKPISWHFPMRNRIISAFADLILVVEARLKSGSLITADAALEQGKEVFAVPGRVGDCLSEGCNRLISQGAGIAWSPDEVLFALFHKNYRKKERVSSYNNVRNNGEKHNNSKSVPFGEFQQNKISGLARDEKTVYSCIGLQPKHINDIAKDSGMELGQALITVFSLETKGYIVETTKNYYGIKIS